MASYASVVAKSAVVEKSVKGLPPPCTSTLVKAEGIDESAGSRGRAWDRANGDGDDQSVAPPRRATSAKRWNKPPAPDATPPESTPESAGAIPLAIVSYGYKMNIAPTIDSYLRDRGYVFMDSAARLEKDPANLVKRGQNGLHRQTRDCVFRQEGFADTIIETINRIVTESPRKRIIAFRCRSGFHRADTSGRTCEAFANSMLDSSGNRIFNAKHFSGSTRSRRREVHTMFADIDHWIGKPFMEVAMVEPEDDRFYGYSGR